MTTRKTQPTPRQRTAVRAQQTHGDNLREWFHHREQKATKWLAKLLKKRRKAAVGTRGVDRVPERYRTVARAPEVVHGDGTPYVNPARDAKSLRSGRLRKELHP